MSSIAAAVLVPIAVVVAIVDFPFFSNNFAWIAGPAIAALLFVVVSSSGLEISRMNRLTNGNGGHEIGAERVTSDAAASGGIAPHGEIAPRGVERTRARRARRWRQAILWIVGLALLLVIVIRTAGLVATTSYASAVYPVGAAMLALLLGVGIPSLVINLRMRATLRALKDEFGDRFRMPVVRSIELVHAIRAQNVSARITRELVLEINGGQFRLMSVDRHPIELARFTGSAATRIPTGFAHNDAYWSVPAMQLEGLVKQPAVLVLARNRGILSALPAGQRRTEAVALKLERALLAS